MSGKKTSDVVFAAFQDSRELLKIMAPNVGIVSIEIGRRDDLTDDALTRSEQAVHDVMTAAPTAKVIISIGGYDDDPRELWQIPEVVDFVVLFIAMAGSVLMRHLANESRIWMQQCCLAWQKDHDNGRREG